MRTSYGIQRVWTWTAVALAGLAAGTAQASSSGATSIHWEIQNTGFTGDRTTAIAMRNGGSWPVVFDDYGNAYSLFATEGPNPGSNWHQIGSGLYVGDNILNIASSPDGRIAILSDIWSNPAGVVSGAQGGWSGLAQGTTAVAFDHEGNLLTARFDGTATGFSLPPEVQETYNIFVSKYGDIGVIGGNFGFYELNHLLGTWQYQDLQSVLDTGHQYSNFIYDSFARPHALKYQEEGTIEGVHFDVPSGQWVTSPILTIGPSSYLPIDFMVLAGNDDGVVGTSFVFENILYYAYKDKNADWAVSTVDTDVDNANQVGITYDFEGLPVISYVKDGLIHVAYDPIITITPGLIGDLNQDGFVGIDDLNLILSQWNDNVTPNSQADPSGDGFVGIDDLSLLLEHWNTGTPPAEGAAVPEPATLAMLGLGGTAIFRRPGPV